MRIITTPPSSTILTDSSGQFVIADVTPGPYIIVGNYHDSATAQATVHVVAGRSVQADLVLLFEPLTKGSILGKVRNETGQGMSNASITTVPVLQGVKADIAGTYIMTGVEPGPYRIIARSGKLFGEIVADVIAGRTTIADISIREQNFDLGWIVGRIFDRGNVVPDLEVELLQTNEKDTTDSQGRFSFSNVVPGVAALRINFAPGTGRQHTTSVTSGTASIVTLDIGFPEGVSHDDLIAFYPVNGTGTDYSANGLTGEIINATFGTDRHSTPGAALVTEGSIDAGLIVEHVPILNVLPLTMCAWVRIDDPLIANCLVLGKNIHPTGDGYYLTIENKKMVFGYVTNGYSNGFRGDLEVASNAWFHVAMTISATSGTAYINGQPYSMGKVGPSTTKVTTTGHFRLGSHQVSIAGAKGFKGAIDDVFIYNRVLTRDEILNLIQVRF
ncbi:MAG: LamG-like jellyroll fold domain-containing protein [bacterium]|nr:LamG-like jellyroll fold domain-containing protein [bacterium]